MHEVQYNFKGIQVVFYLEDINKFKPLRERLAMDKEVIREKFYRQVDRVQRQVSEGYMLRQRAERELREAYIKYMRVCHPEDIK